MESAEIVRRFLDYFSQRGHAVVPSASLIADDPTLLLVNAGIAMARPLVSTSLACEGLDVVPGRHLLVADDPMRFAEAVIQLLEDRSLADRLGANGRRLMESRYSWTAATARLEELHDRVLAGHSARERPPSPSSRDMRITTPTH